MRLFVVALPSLPTAICRSCSSWWRAERRPTGAPKGSSTPRR